MLHMPQKRGHLQLQCMGTAHAQQLGRHAPPAVTVSGLYACPGVQQARKWEQSLIKVRGDVSRKAACRNVCRAAIQLL